MNLYSKIKLSGRNLFYVVVFGGSISCVVNIFMNEGNVLLEVFDNIGEILVKMVIKLYGEDGDIVKFLNVYFEFYWCDVKYFGFFNYYWDNFE